MTIDMLSHNSNNNNNNNNSNNLFIGVITMSVVIQTFMIFDSGMKKSINKNKKISYSKPNSKPRERGKMQFLRRGSRGWTKEVGMIGTYCTYPDLL